MRLPRRQALVERKKYSGSLPAVGAVPYSADVPINDRIQVFAVAGTAYLVVAGAGQGSTGALNYPVDPVGNLRTTRSL